MGGWGATKARRLIYREKLWVDGRNQIWRNCYKCEEEESSRWWEQLQQNYENRSMYGHVGQPTNCSLMNEVDETERNVSVVQTEDRQPKRICLWCVYHYRKGLAGESPRAAVASAMAAVVGSNPRQKRKVSLESSNLNIRSQFGAISQPLRVSVRPTITYTIVNG